MSADEDTWLDPATGITWTRPTAWAYAQVCRVRDEHAAHIDHIQSMSTTLVEKVRALEADNQRLLDIVANILSCYTNGCRSQARQELFSRFNASFGFYCRVCALRELKRLQKDEDDRAQSQTQSRTTFLGHP